MNDPIDDGIDRRITEALHRQAQTQQIVPPGVMDVRRRVARRRRRLATTGAVAVLAPAVIGLVSLAQREPATTPIGAGVGVGESPSTTTLMPSTSVPWTTTSAPMTVFENETLYTVQEGDYPSTVASMFGVPYEDFMALNGFVLDEVGFLPEWKVGLVVRIPAGAVVPPTTPSTPSVISGGYRCAGFQGSDGVYEYYVSCEPNDETVLTVFTTPPATTSTVLGPPPAVVETTAPGVPVTSIPNEGWPTTTTCEPQTYQIQPGDTPVGIADAAGVDVSALIRANEGVSGFAQFVVGTLIRLPSGAC